MRKIPGIVSGLVALRIVEEEGRRRCEKFEFGNWSEPASFRLEELSSSAIIKKWLGEHNQPAKKEVKKFYGTAEEQSKK